MRGMEKDWKEMICFNVLITDCGSYFLLILLPIPLGVGRRKEGSDRETAWLAEFKPRQSLNPSISINVEHTETKTLCYPISI